MKNIFSNFNCSRFLRIYGIIIAVLILSQVSLPGVVFCFGTDGHVAIENYSSGSCCEYISTHKDEVPHYVTAIHTNQNHCGPCVDIRVSDNNSDDKLTTSSDKISQANIYAAVINVIDSLWSQDNTSQRIKVHDLPIDFNKLDFLRTTVLTC